MSSMGQLLCVRSRHVRRQTDWVAEPRKVGEPAHRTGRPEGLPARPAIAKNRGRPNTSRSYEAIPRLCFFESPNSYPRCLNKGAKRLRATSHQVKLKTKPILRQEQAMVEIALPNTTPRKKTTKIKNQPLNVLTSNNPDLNSATLRTRAGIR